MSRSWAAITLRRRCRGRPIRCAAAVVLISVAEVAALGTFVRAQPMQPARRPAVPMHAPALVPPPPSMPMDAPPEWPATLSESPPVGEPGYGPDWNPPGGWYGEPAQHVPDQGLPPGWSMRPDCPRPGYCHVGDWLGLRHSETHGRNVGLGWPLTGTSWLNRPYYFGGELGPLWITRSPGDNLSRDTDFYGGIFFGWDWDYYWGGELHFDRGTPEIENRVSPGGPRRDAYFQWSYNQMYYPWGDSMIRPYWRWGIGNTHFDFPTDDGGRRDEWMLTFPIGIGVKYPIRRWLAARAELTDHLTVGHNGVGSQNIVTVLFGLEYRFGAHPRSYWPWHPSRHIW